MARDLICKFCGANDPIKDSTYTSIKRVDDDTGIYTKRVTYRTFECGHCEMLSTYVQQIERIYYYRSDTGENIADIPF